LCRSIIHSEITTDLTSSVALADSTKKSKICCKIGESSFARGHPLRMDNFYHSVDVDSKKINQYNLFTAEAHMRDKKLQSYETE
jgi:hypothetical protein